MKKGFAMSFNWLFALIVGGAILFLALFVVSQFIFTAEVQRNTVSAAQFLSVLDSFETGGATGKATRISFQDSVEITYSCSVFDTRPFGRQTVTFREDFLEEGNAAGAPVAVSHRYIFSPKKSEGKSVEIFTTEFSLGVPVGDITAVIDRAYCFIDAPRDVSHFITGIGLEGISLVKQSASCEGVEVCFDANDPSCAIVVRGLCTAIGCENRYVHGVVEKDGKRLPYYGSLMYGAIVADEEIYTCAVKRLLQRFVTLSDVYGEKIVVLDAASCSHGIAPVLQSMRTRIEPVSSSLTSLPPNFFSDIHGSVESLDTIQEGSPSECVLY